MDAAAELGRNPVRTRFSLNMEMSRLTWDGTAEPVSRDQILRHERGQGNIHFSCSADHEQDWQPYPVDPYSCYMCDHTVDGARNFERSTWYVFISDIVPTAADFKLTSIRYLHFFFCHHCPLLFSLVFLPFFVFFGDVAFSEYFCTVQYITMVSTSYVFPSGWCFSTL